MWHLTPDHLRKAKEALREQLAELKVRQDDEVVALKAQHAREHQELDDKLAELHRLETAIESFAGEWVPSTAPPEEPMEAPPSSAVQATATESPESELAHAEPAATAMNGRPFQPARSLLRFPSRRRLR
jgi:uncharacterized membrane protein